MSVSGTFHYLNPPTVHFGDGCIERLLHTSIVDRGYSKPLIVTSNSLLSTPALSYVRAASPLLTAAATATATAHTPIQDVHSIAELAHKTSADVLIAIGGGSAIDAAKLAAYSLGPGGNRIFESAAALQSALSTPFTGSLPVIAAATTLSVAELCGGAGYAELGTLNKTGTYADAMIPECVFFDPHITDQTPQDLWLTTGIRAIDHAIEGLLSPQSNPLSEDMCISAVLRLVEGLKAFHKNPHSRSVRLETQIGAWQSYSLPRESGRGLSHTLGKALGSVNAIPHGVTSCLLLPHVLRYYANRPEAARLRPLATAMRARFGRPHHNETGKASTLYVASHIGALTRQLNLPRHISEFDVPLSELDRAAELVCARDGLDLIEVRQILTDAT